MAMPDDAVDEEYDDSEELFEAQIAFEPMAAELVENFKALCKKHCPQAHIGFFYCGTCENLHISIDGRSDHDFMIDIPKDQWKRREMSH